MLTSEIVSMLQDSINQNGDLEIGVAAEYENQEPEFSGLLKVEKILVRNDDESTEEVCGIRVSLSS